MEINADTHVTWLLAVAVQHILLQVHFVHSSNDITYSSG